MGGTDTCPPPSTSSGLAPATQLSRPTQFPSTADAHNGVTPLPLFLNGERPMDYGRVRDSRRLRGLSPAPLLHNRRLPQWRSPGQTASRGCLCPRLLARSGCRSSVDRHKTEDLHRPPPCATFHDSALSAPQPFRFRYGISHPVDTPAPHAARRMFRSTPPPSPVPARLSPALPRAPSTTGLIV